MTKVDHMSEYVTINGTSYATANLSDAAKSQVANVQIADAEIARLQQLLAIAQTARNAYFQALLGELKNREEKTEGLEKPRKTRSTAKKKSAEAV